MFIHSHLGRNLGLLLLTNFCTVYSTTGCLLYNFNIVSSNNNNNNHQALLKTKYCPQVHTLTQKNTKKRCHLNI